MRVFITGMAGTLGTALAIEHHERGDEVIGCSRNELNCLKWTAANTGVGKLLTTDAFMLGRLDWSGVDRLYHCAAVKHIDVCETQPLEALRQNVELTYVVVDACVKRGVNIVLASTDKACRPDSVYGATKLAAERIVLNAGGTVVRLGNLIGSSGSVFQTWRQQIGQGQQITVTDPDMTRWFITVKQAARFMSQDNVGRVWPVQMKAARMGDVVGVMTDNVKVIGLRPGETLHQWISEDCSSEYAKRWDAIELLREAGISNA